MRARRVDLDERVDNLPKWAKGEIQALVRRVEEAESRLEDLDLGDPAVVVDRYERFPRPVAEEGEYVRVLLDGLNGYRWIDFRKGRGAEVVEVMASSGLVIEAGASNTLRLRVSR